MSKRMFIWPRKPVIYGEMTHEEVLMYSWITWLLRKHFEGASWQNGHVARLIIQLLRERKSSA